MEELLSGQPYVMYFIPEIYGGYDLGKNIDIIDAAICQEMYTCQKQIWLLNF